MIDRIKRVTQSRTGMPAGNCTEACVASLLQVDLEEVPQLWSGDPDPHQPDPQPDENWARLLGWLHERRVLWASTPRMKPRSLPLHLPGLGLPTHLCRGYHMLSGPGAGGVPHYVIAHAGHVVWDPNPGRGGVTHCDGLAWLVRLDNIDPELLLCRWLEVTMQRWEQA